MKIHQCAQQSEEWFAIKKGRISASNLDKIITSVKGDLSKSAGKYIRELIGECFCPTYASFLGNKWTDRGNELEPEAREAFALHIGRPVHQVGFVTGDMWKGVVGCSPDGLLGDSAETATEGVEIKCPSPAVHVGYVLDGVLPDEYKQQVHGSMAITGLNRWHFWSFFPGMKPLHVVVERDEYTAKVEAAITEFVFLYRDAREKAVPLLQVNTQTEDAA